MEPCPRKQGHTSALAEEERECRNHKSLVSQQLRSSRNALCREIAVEVERAMENNNTGAMNRLTKQLNIWSRYNNDNKEVDEVTAEKFRESIELVAGAANELPADDHLKHFVQRPVEHWLGEPPEAEEVNEAWRGMRDSAAGRDEVTIGMLRASPLEVRTALAALISRMWANPLDPEVWASTVHASVLVMLYKKEIGMIQEIIELSVCCRS